MRKMKLFLSIFLTLCLSSCIFNKTDSGSKTNSNITSNTVVQELKEEQPTTVTEEPKSDAIEQLIVSDASYESIKKFLDAKSDVEYDYYKWNNSKSAVVFHVYNVNNHKERPRLYIWNVGHKEPKQVTAVGDYFYPAYYEWSPNGKYFFVNSGTAYVRYGYIVSVKDLGIVNEFGFTNDIAWSPDSKYMAVSKRVEMKTAQETEIEGTTNMVILNVESSEEKIIETGTAQYFYEIVKWGKDGKLIFNKISFSDYKDKKECYYSIDPIVINKTLEKYYDYFLINNQVIALLDNAYNEKGFTDDAMAAFAIMSFSDYNYEKGNTKEEYDLITEKYFGKKITNFDNSMSEIIPVTNMIRATGWSFDSTAYMILKDITELGDGVKNAQFYAVNISDSVMMDFSPPRTQEQIKKDLLSGNFTQYGKPFIVRIKFEERSDEKGNMYLKYLAVEKLSDAVDTITPYSGD